MLAVIHVDKMKKKIYNRFDKHEISDLPRILFPGRVITIITPGETEKAVDYLLGSDILGVDTETRPAFRKGQHFKVSLLQVANRTTCFLFRLNRTGMTPAIIRLLEDTTVPKVGLSWHDDLLGLHKRAEFKPGWFVDLQDLVGEIGIEDLSLQKLYANLFHQKISKAQRLSNWEADILKDNQKLYAATDAWTCINLFEEINRLKETRDYELIIKEEPKPEVSSGDIVNVQETEEKDTKEAPNTDSAAEPRKRGRKKSSTKEASAEETNDVVETSGAVTKKPKVRKPAVKKTTEKKATVRKAKSVKTNDSEVLPEKKKTQRRTKNKTNEDIQQ